MDCALKPEEKVEDTIEFHYPEWKVGRKDIYVMSSLTGATKMTWVKF